MRKCRWRSTRVVNTDGAAAPVSNSNVSVFLRMRLNQPPPSTGSLPVVFFSQSARCFFFPVLFLSLTFSPSLLHSIFCMQGLSTPLWCFKAGEGDEQRRESRVEEAGTYVTDDESIGLSVSLILPTFNQRDVKLLQKGHRPLSSLRPLTPVHPLWRERGERG